MSQVEHNQRVNSVGIMAPGIMHDVNNQLTVVLGQITICRTILEAHPELQPHLRAAEGATLKCTEVLRALMDYSRPDHGRRELLSLNVVVREAASMASIGKSPKGTRKPSGCNTSKRLSREVSLAAEISRPSDGSEAFAAVKTGCRKKRVRMPREAHAAANVQRPAKIL